MGPTTDVETTLYRALALLRVVVLGSAAVVNGLQWDELARPGLTAVLLVLLAGWTAFVTWAYDAPARRRPLLLLADLAVAVAMIALTLVVQTDEQLRDPSTLPSFWVMSVVLAWGIRWHWLGGLVAATVVSAADLLIREDVTSSAVGNVFLLMIGGPVVGYTTGLLTQMAEARDRAERDAAAAAERTRLARAVHDGVLQVLSLVQRRGLELGGDAADLGRLAGEQEVALRTLVQHDDTTRWGGSGDLSLALVRLERPGLTVSVPAERVVLPAGTVDELVDATRACLDNVERHAGPEAHAWVLLEDLGDRIVVSVRDDGPGLAPGRLDEASVEGRLGVRQSIRGRLEDLGGAATLVSTPGQGAEWELSLPRSAPGLA